MCDAWTARTGIATVVLRPVLILDDSDPRLARRDDAEFGAYVHIEDIVAAVGLALDVDVPRHVRMTVCGPGEFDTARARTVLGWEARRGWS